MMRIVFWSLFFLGWSLVSTMAAPKADLPENWPWRGVVVNSFDTTPADVQFLKEYLGINHLALHMKTRLRAQRFNQDPEKAWANELQWIDAMLDACRGQGLPATVVNSEFPIDPQLDLRQDSPGFWNSEKHLADLYARVEKMALHLKNRGTELAAYEILAEPVLRDGNKARIPENWSAVRERVIRTLRKHDPERWVVVAPGPGGEFGEYARQKRLDFPRLIYAAHAYQPHRFTHQGIKGQPPGLSYPGQIGIRRFDKEYLRSVFQPLRDFQLKYDVPVWIGEFSAVRWAEGAEKYLLDEVAMFKEYGWSFSYFQFKGYHGWNPDYNTTYATDKRSDWSKDYVGLSTARWQTLREIFGVASQTAPLKKKE